MKFFLLNFLAALAVAAAQAPPCPKKCPSVTTQHFLAKGCEPVNDAEVDACCPVRWNCPTPEQLGRTPTSCFYNGKVYQLGEEVPVDNVCQRGCQCRKSHKEGDMAEIECASVECSERGRPLEIGCRHIYSNDHCCSVNLECNAVVAGPLPANATIKAPDCEAEGVKYLFGQRMRFLDHPCKSCVCSKEFKDPSQDASCKPVDCGMSTSYKHYLDAGCTPLYLNGTCCPTDFVCPESNAYIYDEFLQANGTETASTHCILGKTAAIKGESLDMFDCHNVCLCLTPPYFTCTRYPTCADAVYARKALESF